MSGLHTELQSIQTKLIESQSQTQQEKDKLREARKALTKLEENNAFLTAQLTAAQVNLVVRLQ